MRITVYRPDESIYKEFELERRVINISWISSEVLDEGIGIYTLNNLMMIFIDFEMHLNSLMANGIKGLIIDLRDNPEVHTIRLSRLQTGLYQRD